MERPSNKTYQFYNATAHHYESERFYGRAGRWNSSIQEDIVKEALGDLKNKKVLEIGCGTGRCTKMLLDAGFTNITAIEPSRKMLELAKKKCHEGLALGYINFIETDAESLRCQDKYDAVVLVNVFSRIPDGENFLNRIGGLVGNGGRLFFNFQCITSILGFFGVIVNRRRKSLARDVFSRWYFPREISGLLENREFRIRKWYGHHYLPVPHMSENTAQDFGQGMSKRFRLLCQGWKFTGEFNTKKGDIPLEPQE